MVAGLGVVLGGRGGLEDMVLLERGGEVDWKMSEVHHLRRVTGRIFSHGIVCGTCI